MNKEEKIEKAQVFVKEYEAKKQIIKVLLAVPNEADQKDGDLYRLAKKLNVDITFVNKCLGTARSAFKIAPSPNQKRLEKIESIKYEICKAKIKKHNKEPYNNQKDIADKMYVEYQTVKNISSKLNRSG